MAEPLIAIDIGTVDTRLAFIAPDGRQDLLRFGDGTHFYPSLVFLDHDRLLFGHDAKVHADSDPNNALYALKRYLAGEFDRPFDRLTPKAVLNDFFVHLRREIGRSVLARIGLPERCVLTVPVEFDAELRSVYRAFAHQIGFEKVAVVAEPIAAALPYVRDLPNGSNVLVLDWGGGTLDVAVLRVQHDRLTELGHSGSPLARRVDQQGIGGVVLDEMIAEHLAVCFREAGVARRTIDDQFARVRREAKRVKEALSLADQEMAFFLDMESGSAPVSIEFTRRELDSILAPALQIARDVLDVALHQAGMNSRSIDRVLLVGGCFFIPSLRDFAMERFDPGRVRFVDEKRDAVSRGALQLGSTIADDLRLAHRVGLLVANYHEDDELPSAPFSFQQVWHVDDVSLELFLRSGEANRLIKTHVDRFFVGSRRTGNGHVILVEDHETIERRPRYIRLGQVNVPCVGIPDEEQRNFGGRHHGETITVKLRLLASGAIKVAASSEMLEPTAEVNGLFTNISFAFRPLPHAGQ